MVKQASNVRKRLRRFLNADPGRFAGGSAVSDPLGLLAVERERLAVLRSPQHDGSSQTAATVNQGNGSTSHLREQEGCPVPGTPLPQTREPGRGFYGFDAPPAARP
jgi:hypothetical protein